MQFFFILLIIILPYVSREAARALSNLATNRSVSGQISDLGAIPLLTSYLLISDTETRRMCMAALANIATSDRSHQAFISAETLTPVTSILKIGLDSKV